LRFEDSEKSLHQIAEQFDEGVTSYLLYNGSASLSV